ncbi:MULTISPECIES: PP0621 family protein [unclassified Lebetimonas]|uniref:PP0621 family protein n=1 Tax=unclassified Lebetimonas TaxID=2648158 RepID=UPI0004668233|nr:MULTISPECIES: PP0621 family protein [unclassified Lebetimonas]
MGKIIIFLIIIGVIYYMFRPNKKIKKDNNDENEFVQCEKCKTFVLKKDAKFKNGKYYCRECDADS